MSFNFGGLNNQLYNLIYNGTNALTCSTKKETATKGCAGNGVWANKVIDRNNEARPTPQANLATRCVTNMIRFMNNYPEAVFVGTLGITLFFEIYFTELPYTHTIVDTSDVSTALKLNYDSEYFNGSLTATELTIVNFAQYQAKKSLTGVYPRDKQFWPIVCEKALSGDTDYLLLMSINTHRSENLCSCIQQCLNLDYVTHSMKSLVLKILEARSEAVT